MRIIFFNLLCKSYISDVTGHCCFVIALKSNPKDIPLRVSRMGGAQPLLIRFLGYLSKGALEQKPNTPASWISSSKLQILVWW